MSNDKKESSGKKEEKKQSTEKKERPSGIVSVLNQKERLNIN
nr:hypothetical protein [Pseudomonas mendocina]